MRAAPASASSWTTPHSRAPEVPHVHSVQSTTARAGGLVVAPVVAARGGPTGHVDASLVHPEDHLSNAPRYRHQLPTAAEPPVANPLYDDDGTASHVAPRMSRYLDDGSYEEAFGVGMGFGRTPTPVDRTSFSAQHRAVADGVAFGGERAGGGRRRRGDFTRADGRTYLRKRRHVLVGSVRSGGSDDDTTTTKTRRRRTVV